MGKSISTKSRSSGWVSIFVVVFLLCGWMRTGLAQESKVDRNALSRETQKITRGADRMTIIWWIPEEFWRISLAQDTTVTEDQVEALINVLRPYTLIVIADGNIDASGGITYRSEIDLQTRIRIKDSQGMPYFPLSEDEVDAGAKNLLSRIKPALIKMLGSMGQNMHFFFFPAKNKQGQSIADAKSRGAFSLRLDKKEFRWRLPLGSLFPPKICLKCKEECYGTWNFCPWCGIKLPKQNR